jgi:hypothetical protein
MKATQPILKALFVAVLVVLALSRPSPARAQGQCYTCESGPMGSCEQSAQQWMVGCVNGCPHQGDPTQVCYSALQCTGSGSTLDCEYTQDCTDYPSSGVSCVQQCIDEMDVLTNNCVESYCDVGC